MSGLSAYLSWDLICCQPPLACSLHSSFLLLFEHSKHSFPMGSKTFNKYSKMTSYPTSFSIFSVCFSLDRQRSIPLPHKFMFPFLACLPCKDLLSNIYVLVIHLIFWLSSLLECKSQEQKVIYLLCSLLFFQYLKQYLVLRCSKIFFEWLNICIYKTKPGLIKMNIPTTNNSSWILWR